VEVECAVSVHSFELRRILFLTLSKQFGLSSPNQYPRGYPLPFFITLKSDIPSALHLLATPQAIVVTLKRTLYFRLAESNKRAKYFEETVAKGKCWSYSPLMVLEETKSLQGEIFVKKDMFPSFKSPTIFLEVRVYPSPYSEHTADFALCVVLGNGVDKCDRFCSNQTDQRSTGIHTRHDNYELCSRLQTAFIRSCSGLSSSIVVSSAVSAPKIRSFVRSSHISYPPFNSILSRVLPLCVTQLYCLLSINAIVLTI
jgi:hypothetical protein